MHIERGVIKIGLEIEVASWKDGYSYQKVAQELLEAEYMVGDRGLWSKTHNYHCSCAAGGCKVVRKGTLVVPPIVSMTYDASLPKYGAEFVVSPVLMSDNGMEHLKNIWDIVSAHAEWTNKVKDIHERPASPSIHLHVSATLAEKKLRQRRTKWQADTLHALTLYAPEFFAIADMCDYRRGLTYRLPTRDAMADDALSPVSQDSHHGFVQVIRSEPEEEVYIEWRLFEAAYESWDYVETAAYLTAVLTRAFLNRGTVGQLMATGYAHPFDEAKMAQASALNQTVGVLNEVNMDRLQLLRQLIAEQLDDDAYAMEKVMTAFEKVESSL